MPWLSVSIDVRSDRVEALADRLSVAGAVAVTVQPGEGAAAVLEPLPGAAPIWAEARLDALFPVNADLAALRRLLERCAVLRDVSFVEDRDWSDAWRHTVTLQHYAGRLSVVPRDHPADDLAGALVRLDPGLAFGTGAHVTTAMCLEMLASRELEGLRVADVGCGSGILAISALVLGAGAVLAIDHDPQALSATRDNAAFNDVLDHRLTVTDALPLADRYDLVVANILADPLVELSDRLAALVEVQGSLILSGILEEQVDDLLGAYPQFSFAPPMLREDWVCMEGKRGD